MAGVQQLIKQTINSGISLRWLKLAMTCDREQV